MKNERSQQDITTALIHLLNETNYSFITITTICERALISRKTFYNYFKVKEDVINYYLHKVINRFMGKCDLQAESFMSIMEKIYSGFNDNRPILKSFYNNNLIRLATSIAVTYLTSLNIFEGIISGPAEEWHKVYLPSLIIFNISNIVLIWIENGFKESPLELAYITKEYFHSTVAKN
ncbi:MAG: TetR/AcrR family transcriptional regulator [Acholeplasmatales bacterium]|jgi:AcrR family transcriptional regulator|nr:TetR/AcrR family transcriptional regulator [Acholeplasmatales bacterium]